MFLRLRSIFAFCILHLKNKRVVVAYIIIISINRYYYYNCAMVSNFSYCKMQNAKSVVEGWPPFYFLSQAIVKFKYYKYYILSGSFLPCANYPL